MTETVATAAVERKPAFTRRRSFIRLGILFAMAVALYVAGEVSGVTKDLSVDRIRALVEGAGPWGFVIYVGLFIAGGLLNVPGMLFVGAAVLAWGQPLGFAAAHVAALASVSTTFVLGRTIGGRAFAEVENPRMKRLLGKLEAQPIAIVVALRTVFGIAPPLNYALSLSRIRFLHYVIGSALGLIVPNLVASFVFNWLLK